MKEKISTILCFAVAASFIVIGLMQNQHIKVLNKAIKICMECVGIG